MEHSVCKGKSIVGVWKNMRWQLVEWKKKTVQGSILAQVSNGDTVIINISSSPMRLSQRRKCTMSEFLREVSKAKIACEKCCFIFFYWNVYPLVKTFRRKFDGSQSAQLHLVIVLVVWHWVHNPVSWELY